MQAFFDWDKLKLFFSSDDKNDFVKANLLLDESGIDCSEKDMLIEDLNRNFPDWHFFMVNCSIKRVKASKSYFKTGFTQNNLGYSNAN